MFKRPTQAYPAECKEQAVTRVTAVGRMSHNGHCGENAPTERGVNSFKNERVHGIREATRAAMTAASVEYIEVCYTRTRRHSTLGCQSPMPVLDEWRLAQHEENLVA